MAQSRGWRRFWCGWRRNEGEFFGDLHSGTANQLGDHSCVQARGVVFNANGVRGAVEADAANAVDIASIGQCEHL